MFSITNVQIIISNSTFLTFPIIDNTIWKKYNTWNCEYLVYLLTVWILTVDEYIKWQDEGRSWNKFSRGGFKTKLSYVFKYLVKKK